MSYRSEPGRPDFAPEFYDTEASLSVEEDAAYLAHVDAEHAAHDCDEVHGPHDCTLEEPEESHSYPTRGGDITVTVACPVCGNVLHTYRDSIL